MEKKKYSFLEIIVYSMLGGLVVGLLITTNPFWIGVAGGVVAICLQD